MHLRLIAPAIAALALSLAASACGGAKATGVASLSGHTSTTAAAASRDPGAAKQAFQDAMLNYARCMREHGVDMPDPTFSDSGGGKGTFSVVGAPGGAGKDTGAFTAADKACKPILDKAQQDMPRPTPEEEAKMRDRALALARCMREHGIDMPDPTFDDQGGAKIQLGSASSDDGKANAAISAGGSKPVTVAPKDDPKFKAAMDACGPKDGGGPGFVTSGSK